MFKRLIYRTTATGVAAVGLWAAFIQVENYVVESKLESPVWNNERKTPGAREKVVILGSGWAAVNLLTSIDTNKYDVMCVSPRNFFLFTPLLPAVTVGTLDPHSIVKSMRSVVSYKEHSFLRRLKYVFGIEKPREAIFREAECVEVNPTSKTIKCIDKSAVVGAGSSVEFEVSYDKLIIAVGSATETFNTPGVKEHCFFIKEIEDGLVIRDHLIDCFETASLTTDVAAKKKLLSIVIVGGGPTGTEFAAEVIDFVHEDLATLYRESAGNASITLIQSAGALLNTYSEVISEFTEKNLKTQGIHIIKNARTTEVTADHVMIIDKASNRKSALEYSTCVWAAGTGCTPLVKAIKALNPGFQTNARALTTDHFMRVKGFEDMYAVGDCSTVAESLLQKHCIELFEKHDANGSKTLDEAEFQAMLQTALMKFPQASVFLRKAQKKFKEFDTDGSGEIKLDEFKAMLKLADNSLVSYPGTAQVASQQGLFLAKLLNGDDEANRCGFVYRHQGELCYVGGDKAVAGLGEENSVVMTGWFTGLLWRGAYMRMLGDNRLRTLVMFDWIKAKLYGRDVARFDASK